MKKQPDSSGPDCYGKMFPSVVTLAHNRTVEGRVFGYRLNAPGIVRGTQTTKADTEVWRQCVTCPDFDGCYRLSVGQLLMEMALRG